MEERTNVPQASVQISDKPLACWTIGPLQSGRWTSQQSAHALLPLMAILPSQSQDPDILAKRAANPGAAPPPRDGVKVAPYPGSHKQLAMLFTHPGCPVSQSQHLCTNTAAANHILPCLMSQKSRRPPPAPSGLTPSSHELTRSSPRTRTGEPSTPRGGRADSLLVQ